MGRGNCWHLPRDLCIMEAMESCTAAEKIPVSVKHFCVGMTV